MRPENPQLALVRRKLAMDGVIDIPSVGYSMFPVIRNGDLCRFKPVDAGKEDKLKPGDILLFADTAGRLIGHRLLLTKRFGEQAVYVCKGDTNEFADDPVHEERLLGVLISIKRLNRRGHNKTIPARGRMNTAWGTVLRKIPLLSVWLRRVATVNAAWNVRLAQKR